MKTLMISVLFAAIVFINGCAKAIDKPVLISNAAEPPTKTQNAKTVSIFSPQFETLKGSLDSGAAVYIGKVAKREPSPKTVLETEQWKASIARETEAKSKLPPSPVIEIADDAGGPDEYGNVTITVGKTLRGTSQKSLVLPYHFIPAGSFNINGSEPWSPFNVGDTLICVVIPGGFDPGTVPIPGINEAASQVVNVDKDPKAAAEIEAICAEYNAKAAK